MLFMKDKHSNQGTFLAGKSAELFNRDLGVLSVLTEYLKEHEHRVECARTNGTVLSCAITEYP